MTTRINIVEIAFKCIFVVATLVFLCTPSPVMALGYAGTPGTLIYGQVDEYGCPLVRHGGSYSRGYGFPFSSVSVYETKLIVADGNGGSVKIYNTIPITNNPLPDITLGKLEVCSSPFSAGNPYSVGTPVNTFYDGTHFFVVDYTSHRVLIYNHGIPTATGTAADVVIGQPDMYSNTANNGGISANSLSSPFDIWTDGTKLIIADGNNSRVLIYNAIPTSNFAPADVVIGQTSMTSNGNGVSSSTLNSVRGIASDGTKLFVADKLNNRVLIFNTIPSENGATADTVIGQPDMTHNTANNGGLGANTLNVPMDVNIKNGQVYIGDSANHRVLIFNTVPIVNNVSADVVVGQVDFTHNSANQGGTPSANTLYTPYAGYSDGSKFYVEDYNNNRVLIYNTIPSSNNASADVVLGQKNMTNNTSYSGGPADANSFLIPSNMFFDGTKLYITVFGDRRVLIYNSLPSSTTANANVVVGQPYMTTSTAGTTAGKFNYPYGAVADEGHNKLFVADTYNNRVLIYNSIPTTNGEDADVVIGQADMTHGSANAGGLSAKSIYNAGSVFIDKENQRLFIADTNNNRVLIFNSYPTTDNQAADVVIGQVDFTRM